MRNSIIWVITALVMWVFPARWGAEYFFPEVCAQFASQMPWIMAWGGFMFFLTTVTAALLARDD